MENYEDVDSRIEKFYAAFPVPKGRILTELLTPATDLEEVVVKAYCYVDGDVIATGLASEKRNGGSNPVNKNFHIENCETSAIGRALANMGFKSKPDAARPTRQEMEKPQRQGTATTGAAKPQQTVRPQAAQTPEEARSQAWRELVSLPDFPCKPDDYAGIQAMLSQMYGREVDLGGMNAADFREAARSLAEEPAAREKRWREERVLTGKYEEAGEKPGDFLKMDGKARMEELKRLNVKIRSHAEASAAQPVAA